MRLVCERKLAFHNSYAGLRRSRFGSHSGWSGAGTPAEGSEVLVATTVRIRRQPRQARSRAMVERILAAAGELFVARGYAATTTNLIAERADVSVGSLYQFFADKDEIVATLQADYAARLDAALDPVLRPVPDARANPVQDLVDHVLDVHADLNRQPPGLLGFLLTAPTGTSVVMDVARAAQRRLVGMIEAYAPAMPPERREVVASMLVHVSAGLYTVGTVAGATDPLVRAEVRTALLSYIAAQLEA